MVFHGVGPLGCIPSQRVKSRGGQCLKRVNEWIMEFNSRVQKLIHTLNHRLPNAKLTFADTYPLVLDLINNPTVYGNSAPPNDEDGEDDIISYFTSVSLSVLQVLRFRILRVAM